MMPLFPKERLKGKTYTLKELIEGKTFPVRASVGLGQMWFEIHYEHNGKYYGHASDGDPMSDFVDAKKYVLIHPKSPRLLAWVCVKKDFPMGYPGQILFIAEGEQNEITKPIGAFAEYWKRAPWLDEPEEG